VATVKFNEGKDYIDAGNGFPATFWWALSTKPCSGTGAHAATDTLAGGFGEATGTGYGRQSYARPTSTNGVMTGTQVTFSTGSATDWPNNVKSAVLVSSSGAGGKLIAAIDLAATRDMSAASRVIQGTWNVTLS
jgi:hypothetical protein